jgi:hypothetical protein
MARADYLGAADEDAMRALILQDAETLLRVSKSKSKSKSLIRGCEEAWRDTIENRAYKSRFYFLNITDELRALGGGDPRSAMADLTAMLNDDLFSQRQADEVSGVEFVPLADLLERCSSQPGAVWQPHAQWILKKDPVARRSNASSSTFQPLPTFTAFFAKQAAFAKAIAAAKQPPATPPARSPTQILVHLLGLHIAYDPDRTSISEAMEAMKAMKPEEEWVDARRGSARKVRVDDDAQWLARQIGRTSPADEADIAIAALEHVVRTARLRRLIPSPEDMTLAELGRANRQQQP